MPASFHTGASITRLAAPRIDARTLVETDALGIEGGLSDADRAWRTVELRERLDGLKRAERPRSVPPQSRVRTFRAEPTPARAAVLQVRIVDAREMAAGARQVL
jgi:hypothetical protein